MGTVEPIHTLECHIFFSKVSCLVCSLLTGGSSNTTGPESAGLLAVVILWVRISDTGLLLLGSNGSASVELPTRCYSNVAEQHPMTLKACWDQVRPETRIRFCFCVTAEQLFGNFSTLDSDRPRWTAPVRFTGIFGCLFVCLLKYCLAWGEEYGWMLHKHWGI